MILFLLPVELLCQQFPAGYQAYKKAICPSFYFKRNDIIIRNYNGPYIKLCGETGVITKLAESGKITGPLQLSE